MKTKTETNVPSPPPSPQTVLLHPTPTTELIPSPSILNPLTHLVASSHLVATASATAVTVFQLSPYQALARWPLPSDYSVSSFALSPDASLLALVLTVPFSSSTLFVLHSRSLHALIRLTLPFDKVSLLSFFAATPSTTSSPPPSSHLPPHLQSYLAYPLPLPPPPSTPTAPYALAVAADYPTTPLVYHFHPHYRRLHHLTSVQYPHQLQMQPARRLHYNNTPDFSLAFFGDHHAFYYAAGKLHPLITDSDFPLLSILAFTTHPLSTIALLRRPNGAVAIAVFHTALQSVTLLPAFDHLSLVQHVSLFPSSPRSFCAVFSTGLLLQVFAHVHLVPDLGLRIDTTHSATTPCVKVSQPACTGPTCFFEKDGNYFSVSAENDAVAIRSCLPCSAFSV